MTPTNIKPAPKQDDVASSEVVSQSIPSISIVMPCYNEEEALPKTIVQIEKQISQMLVSGLIAESSKVYLVDDGSNDNTWSIIASYCEQFEFVKGIKLSRNRGHQNALMAGLMNATGDAVISIDADLQDDVNAIQEMIKKFREGSQVVYGVRSKRDTDTVFKRWTAQSYYKTLRMMGVDLVNDHADYRLLSRNAIEELRKFDEVNLFLRGIVPLLGFSTDTVYYERNERIAGESKYPLSKMISFALEGITSFSNVPLRLITGIGSVVSILSFSMVFWVLGVRLFTDEVVPGWASIVIPMFFLGGVQLLCLGIVGEYIAKIYMETKRRPQFTIEKIL